MQAMAQRRVAAACLVPVMLVGCTASCVGGLCPYMDAKECPCRCKVTMSLGCTLNDGHVVQQSWFARVLAISFRWLGRV